MKMDLVIHRRNKNTTKRLAVDFYYLHCCSKSVLWKGYMPHFTQNATVAERENVLDIQYMAKRAIRQL